MVVGLVLVALRSRGQEHGVAVARLAASLLGQVLQLLLLLFLMFFLLQGVVGMDVAGDEGSFPLTGGEGEAMVAGISEATRLGVGSTFLLPHLVPQVPLTLHAGEWPERFGSLANLEWAVREGGVRRVGHPTLLHASPAPPQVGHGIAVRSGPHLLQEIKKRNITVEV